MKIDIDHLAVKLTCPKCGQEIEEKVGRLKHDPTILCPGCGTQITIEAQQLRDGIDRIQKGLDDLGRTVRNLGK